MAPQDASLSRFELEIMEILWELREASVREVQEAIQERKRPAYTTVQTIFARLEEKGAVRRSRKIGNAFLFEPVVSRKSVYRRLIDQFLELFGGSPEPIVSRLVETGKLTLEDLRALESRAEAVEGTVASSASAPTDGSEETGDAPTGVRRGRAAATKKGGRA